MRTLARLARSPQPPSAGVALLIGQVISRLVDGPRPFVGAPEPCVHLFAPQRPTPRFPSDHTDGRASRSRRRSCCATALWGALTMAAAALLGDSRVVIGVHYPLRHHDGRRPVARAEPRGRRALRLPARHAGDPRGRRPQAPTLAGSAGDHIHGQVAVGFIICGVTAYLSVRFLVRYFETKRLTPFAIYSLIVGLISVVHFA